MPEPWSVLLTDGDIRGLVVAAMQTRPERVLALYIHDGRPNDGLHLDAFSQQADHYQFARRLELMMPHLHALSVRPAEGEQVHTATPFRWQQMVFTALSVAAQIDAARLVWPVQAPDQLPKAAEVTEGLMLLADVVESSLGKPIHIDTPLIDLTDQQLIEVGHQMDVPWQLARSCRLRSQEPCGTCSGCDRRRRAFHAAGLDDPLAMTAVR